MVLVMVVSWELDGFVLRKSAVRVMSRLPPGVKPNNSLGLLRSLQSLVFSFALVLWHILAGQGH